MTGVVEVDGNGRPLSSSGTTRFWSRSVSIQKTTFLFEWLNLQDWWL